MMPCRQAGDLAYKAQLDVEIDRADAEEEWRTDFARRLAEHWTLRDAQALADHVFADGPCPLIMARHFIQGMNTGSIPDDLRVGFIDATQDAARSTIDEILRRTDSDRVHVARQLASIDDMLASIPSHLTGELRDRIFGDDL